VFSVSSMSWCGALGHAGYANEIALITGNVLERFIDPAPFPPLPSSPPPSPAPVDPGGSA
jgi:N,N-dimethylformamidase